MAEPASISLLTDALFSVIEKGAPPEWIELIPAGRFSTRDGRGPYINDDPEKIIAATLGLRLEAGLPIDYDHATDLAAPEGRPAPAAGWMKEFEARDGKIFARVEWTPAGAKALEAGEWRYISPVFQFTKQGNVMRILRAGLTNNPAMYLTALAAIAERHEGIRRAIMAEKDDKKGMTGEEFKAKMAKLFGCAENASSEAICEAAGKVKIAKNDAADGDGDEDAMAAKLIAKGVVVSQDSHKALVTEVNSIKAERAREKAIVKVETAMREHKLASAQRDWAIGYCVNDEKGFDDFVAKQPAIHLGEDKRFVGKPGESGELLTADEHKICAAMNMKPEDYVVKRNELAASRDRGFGAERPERN